MKWLKIACVLILSCCSTAIASVPRYDLVGLGIGIQDDSTTVIALNRKGFESRLSNPEQSLDYAKQALELARKLRYRNGEAEAYRIMGIAKYYLNETEKAIADYLSALSLFKAENNLLGEARVYNNIGNLYLGADYDKALEYFEMAHLIAEKLNEKELLANVFLNIGNIYVRKKKYNQALTYYEKGDQLYKETKNDIGITHSLQNRGKIYFELNRLDLAEQLLNEAYKKAKANDLNVAIASINLTVTSLYIRKKEFQKAEKRLEEGVALANLINDTKLKSDFLYTSYELELNRNNHKGALHFLQLVYKQDSINHKNSESAKISLMQEQFRQKELQRENEVITLRQKQNQIILTSTLIVTGMFMVIIVVLARNVRRKVKMNRELTLLNTEVNKQKEELNRINLHLEELINERTKDLQIKNRKLSEYSAHLSHEIRGPVASMKGLMILEQDHIIEHEELMEKMRICINAIDDKIHLINDMLNDPEIPDLKGNSGH